MKEASYFEEMENKSVKCILCPHNCIILNGKSGFCKVRKNINGRLYSLNYRVISAFNIYPVEKKPLFHFYPGKKIVSIGSLGCNLKCSYCQNFDISQFDEEKLSFCNKLSLDKIEKYVVETEDNIGVAYTYNEPTVFYEYMKECAEVIKRVNMVNVAVTNGYINEKPLEDSFEFIDSYSVDLKGFTEEFYRGITRGSLKEVKNNLKKIRDAGKHLEIENLIIPELNDSKDKFREMAKWIKEELGENTILHINRYYPAYMLKIPPAPESKFRELYEVAKKYLNYVYVGNIDVDYGRDTICHKCGNTVIKRRGYNIVVTQDCEDGKCSKCGTKIFIAKDGE